MVLLFRLPFLLIELLLRRLFGGNEPEQERYAPAPPPPAPRTDAPPPPPLAADEAIERRWEREAELAADPPPPPTPLRPISDHGHIDDEPELVESFGPADDAGATITVQEPWDGYASQPAAAIVARLRGADPATKAVVALYERGHKARATVLRATG